jgi:hypothetical protein
VLFVFSRAIRNKTYPLPEILEALTLYDRGDTLEATAAKISSRYGHRVAPRSRGRVGESLSGAGS